MKAAPDSAGAARKKHLDTVAHAALQGVPARVCRVYAEVLAAYDAAPQAWLTTSAAFSFWSRMTGIIERANPTVRRPDSLSAVSAIRELSALLDPVVADLTDSRVAA